MEILISIDGVIRNLIQKFDYHYVDFYLNSDEINEKVDIDSGEVVKNEKFEYNIVYPIQNDNILRSYQFQSQEEFENFTFMEYPIEIFGHAGLSYSTAFTDLHKLIYDNPEHNFTLIGLDEMGKAKPSTLFFLSKNGYLGNNIRFIKSEDIKSQWNNCDIWITDNKKIIDECPEEKTAIKFNTTYNEFFTYKKEITKFSEIHEPCLKFLEKTTTSTLIESSTSVDTTQN